MLRPAHQQGPVHDPQAGSKEQIEFYKVSFDDVTISSVTPAGNAGGDILPMEQVSIDFRSAEIEYTLQRPDGSAGGTVRSECTPSPRGRIGNESE